MTGGAALPLVVAAAAAAASAALLLPGRPTAPTTAQLLVPRVLAALLLAPVTVLLLAPGRVVPALVAIVAGWAGWSLWQRRRGRQEERLAGDRVREACEHLAAELGAGQPPGAALERAAAAWPVLAPVAEAMRVGADVPTALRTAGRHPGAGDLRLLAAAWEVAHRTGQGLSSAVDRVAADLVAARRTRRLVEGELASARATARLVAGLPLLAWAMGSGAGGDPLGFLLGTPVGWGCLAAGAAFGMAGLWWIEALARDADRSA